MAFVEGWRPGAPRIVIVSAVTLRSVYFKMTPRSFLPSGGLGHLPHGRTPGTPPPPPPALLLRVCLSQVHVQQCGLRFLLSIVTLLKNVLSLFIHSPGGFPSHPAVPWPQGSCCPFGPCQEARGSWVFSDVDPLGW